ncbi:MAG: ribonuclease H-like domain-containing protein, partial [Candidatus Riesia sp.]|nr:ribonuclease H-like domain-containing protein [Candidatus Riesia sp.]
MGLTICDIEADGFLDVVTKIHCISVYYQDENKQWQIWTTSDYNQMRKYFQKENQTIVMHYGVMYDIPVVEKILGIKIPESSEIIDTVAISFALYPERTQMNIGHSLESWGEDFGVPKVEIADDAWKDLSVEKAIERCEQDIRINLRLWLKMWDYLI